jgi:hypothetical protein
MVPEAPQSYSLLYNPRIGLPTFSASSALTRALSRESWSCKPVIYMSPTFATSRLREILAAEMWNYVGREMTGKI